MAEDDIDFVDHLPRDIRPVAYVSQLGTAFRAPNDNNDCEQVESSSFIAETISRIMSTETQETSTETPSSANQTEFGQGDAGRHSSLSTRLDYVVPEEELGAVGGVEESSDVRPSSRVPLLNIPLPNASTLREPLRPIYDNDRPLSPPVPVAEVEDQANQIIQGFFEGRWRQETGDAPSELVVLQPGPPGLSALTRGSRGARMSNAQPAASTAPSSNLLLPRAHSPNPNEKINAVSAKLCQIAQEMDQRYSVEFDDMIDFMKLNGSTAYDAFSEVAKQMLSDKITWGKVITLLALGYRMARRVVDLAIPNFVQNIIGYLVTFICKHVAKWIADRGGWLAILNLEEGISWAGFFGIMSVGCAVVAVVSWMKNRM